MSTYSENPLNAQNLIEPDAQGGMNLENDQKAVPEETIKALNRLVQRCIDTRENYEQAADTVETDRFKKLFTEFSEQRNQFATQLSNLILQYNGKPEEFGTDTGSMRRGWENIRAVLSPATEESVLDTLEADEDKTKAVYKEVLDTPLPDKARQIAERQYQELRRVHDEIRDLRNAHAR